VRAVVIDKDSRPSWQPATIEEVSDAQVDAYFAPLPEGDLELGPAVHGVDSGSDSSLRDAPPSGRGGA